MRRRSAPHTHPAGRTLRLLVMLTLWVAVSGCIREAEPRWLVEALPGSYPEVVYFVPTEQRAIALTIDDGLDADTTPLILDVLETHGVNATFFLLSDSLEGNEDLVRRIVEYGHEIGHHMTEDEVTVSLPAPELAEKFHRAADALESVAPVTWFRPGSGRYNDQVLALTRERGYRIALASVAPLDTLITSPHSMATFINWMIEPGSIVVLHDVRERGRRTAATLERLLPILHDRGYRVLTLRELDGLTEAAASRSWLNQHTDRCKGTIRCSQTHHLHSLPAVLTAEAAIRLGVDWNGDGLIQIQPDSRIPVDAPTTERPFIFWINHDQDDLNTGGESWPITRPDASTSAPDSQRDLEDFTRLRIEIDDLTTLPDDAVLHLAWRNGAGGAINLFRTMDATCSRSYLLDTAPPQSCRWAGPHPLWVGSAKTNSASHLPISASRISTGRVTVFCSTSQPEVPTIFLPRSPGRMERFSAPTPWRWIYGM